jgi:hypothetical protein
VAAKYTKQYHRHRIRRNRDDEAAPAAPVVLEFLDRDLQDPVANARNSAPYRIVKQTRKYV